MLIILADDAERADADRIAAIAAENRYHAEIIERSGRLAVAVSGGIGRLPREPFAGIAHIAEIVDGTPPFLASRRFQAHDSVVDVGGVKIGGEGPLVVIAGPCAVESERQLATVAEFVQRSGATLLRAGAYKLRTSPWTFQGLEHDALKLLAAVKKSTGLRVVTEVVSESTLGAVAEVADLIQLGTRNMKNYELLKHVGRCGRPVLLKRGADAQIDELLLSAEYLLAEGSPGVVLCERGVSGFGDHTRNTLDLAAVPAVKSRSHLPIIVDPSHGTGVRSMVTPLARAAVAVGADGLLVEVHPEPEVALSDGPQALLPHDFEQLMGEVRAVASAVGRTV